jgi:NAD(P)-dependent dehydrogenase (short-subunit alcohol dehydrogenase family)
MGAASPDGSFAGKVAFVASAASGIGRAAALAFGREGASVVVADVAEEANQETARLIEDFVDGRARSASPTSNTALRAGRPESCRSSSSAPVPTSAPQSPGASA